MSNQIHKTACILCSRNCGLAAEVREGKFVKIKGDESHPMSKGYICQKAARLEHYQNHADRLQYPLKRQQNGEFVRISWEVALREIAEKLNKINKLHGGNAFAFAGGGGQGNHLGGMYGVKQLLAAMKSRYVYSSLAQEKTGDFWVNGRLFGKQNCHTTEDVEHADYVLFIGCNPFQSHGIPNARDVLREIKKDPNRTMVVIDPRRTETAKAADIHLAVKPGMDAYLMTAMLAIIVQENLHDLDFIQKNTTGFADIYNILININIQDYIARADVDEKLVYQVARDFARAKTACVRIDLGIQHTLHSTLNGYLEKLLYLLTGNFGKKGANNLHASLIPLLGNSDERKDTPTKKLKRTAYHQMMPISGMYPPNILPDEILLAGEKRVRAVVVESSNPILTWADSAKFQTAFESLECLVVIDVAMTETARLAHYVLPAASQFEKTEATGFNLEFPENFYHLRHPIFAPLGESLPEAEIYTRLLVAMGKIPDQFPLLEKLAKLQPDFTANIPYLTALGVFLNKNKQYMPYAASIVYRTLGKNLPKNLEAAAPLLALCLQFAKDHPAAVRRAGISGNKFNLGFNLFQKILNKPEGVIISKHNFSDVWKLIKNKDGKIHLSIAEMLTEWRALPSEILPDQTAWPFILMAGERRSYNANQIYRDPKWRKVDAEGALRIHPNDAAKLNLLDKSQAICQSQSGEISVVIEHDDGMRLGTVSLPHGYGVRFQDGAPIGPEINRLTDSAHCDPFSKTPYHKYVPVNIRAA